MSQRLINIIRHYKKWKAANPDNCISHCANQSTLNEAIFQAALSIDHLGKKHPHQYRLKREYLEDFGNNILLHIDSISNVNNFEDLIRIVRTSRVYGIGELAIYDTAVRIGAFLDIWPDKIYLHAGAKIGALALNPNLLNDIISKDDLPPDFRTSDLSCYELEDILCIYKKMFIHAANH